VRIFEIDDQAEAGIGGAAQDVVALRHDILRFHRLARQPGRAQRRRETGIGKVVVRLIAEAALGDNQRNRRRSGARGTAAQADEPRAQAEAQRAA
jgi:hypothetical protein